MTYYSFNFWTSVEELRPALSKLGYNLETVREFLKDNFGYKTGGDIVRDLGVKKSFLDARLCYKDREKDELVRRLGILIPTIREADSRLWYRKNIYVLKEELEPGNYSIKNTVAAFEVRTRFRFIIKELLGIERNI